MASLSPADAQAIVGLAGRMGVDPGSLAALMEMESGINPDIWGGSGGKHRGLIQFGPGARAEVGLPDRSMTIAEQIPYVEKYFQKRGFKPGQHGVTEMYRTVLVGNPGSSGTDSFGTNSDSAAKRMMPGGDLYKRGLAKLGSSAAGALSGASGRQGVGWGDGSDPMTSGLSALAGLGDDSAATPQPRRAASSSLTGALAAALEDGQRQRLAGGGDLGARVAAVMALPAGMSSAKWKLDEQVDELAGALSGIAMGRTAAGGMSDGGPGIGVGSGSSSGAMSLVDLGKAIQGTGLRVRQHPAFGPVGNHAPDSHHYKGHAFDITDWNDGPEGGGWKERTKSVGELARQIFGDQAEIFHPGYDPVGGHHEHLHLAFPGGRLDPERANQFISLLPRALGRSG